MKVSKRGPHGDGVILYPDRGHDLYLVVTQIYLGIKYARVNTQNARAVDCLCPRQIYMWKSQPPMRWDQEVGGSLGD